jgi:hypothetical protein
MAASVASASGSGLFADKRIAVQYHYDESERTAPFSRTATDLYRLKLV